jgi:hypothetical protein
MATRRTTQGEWLPLLFEDQTLVFEDQTLGFE